MTAQPLFSIVVPVYNREKLISTAIESVLAQTFAHWELLLVDDGSTDNTARVIQSYTDPRIRYIYQQNAERSAARNNGIAQACAPYILFLDSDDYYLPRHLQNIKEALDPTFAGIYLFGMQIDRQGSLTPRAESFAQGAISPLQLLMGVFHNPQVCIPTHLLRQEGFDPAIRIGEDSELWLRLAARHPFYFLPHIKSAVVCEHDGRTISPKNNTLAEYRRTLHRIFAGPSGGHIPKKERKGLLAATYFGEAKSNLLLGRRGKAMGLLFKAFVTQPSHAQSRFWLNLLLRLCVPGSSLAAVYRLAVG